MTVEWEFLRMILIVFGFPIKLVTWVMNFVTTFNYSLLINGGLTEIFPTKKGLRQGDPMSHCLS